MSILKSTNSGINYKLTEDALLNMGFYVNYLSGYNKTVQYKKELDNTTIYITKNFKGKLVSYIYRGIVLYVDTLKQLKAIENFTRIVHSTNDEGIIRYAEKQLEKEFNIE